MKRVVSVSLGSSRGDKTVRTLLLGEEFELSRRSAGSLSEAMSAIRELDGQVDAIGLGGIDRYLYAGDRRYTIRDGDRLARCAVRTPVVDGSGIKNTLEREAITWIQANGPVDLSTSRVLLVCAVDRFGMADALQALGGEVVYGDLMFSMGIPVPLRSHRAVVRMGRLVLPLITRLPFTWFYPTGGRQDAVEPRWERWFRWADVVAGDSKYIFRNMPPASACALAGKTVITQTLTPADVEALGDRGVRYLVTTTREFDGRTFATNVVEAAIVALAGRGREPLSSEEYREWLARLEWTPTVRELNPAP